MRNPDEKNAVLGGVLYLVATPIGNLADLSPRALKVLTEVDLIAAEDTRTAAKLLSCFGIRGRSMLPYHKHNFRSSGEHILAKLQQGLSVALVTDAGMPAISDPGEDLVRLCAENAIPVTGVPGCCAAVTALALSGLATDRFAFEGFLPVSGKQRRERLQKLALEERTLIFYSAPHKLLEDLRDLQGYLGDRSVALCRELTKRNEEIIRTTLALALARYAEDAPRGEYVLIVAGCEADAVPHSDAAVPDTATLRPSAHLARYLDRGLSRMDAMKAAAKDRGIPKGEFYKLLLEDEQSE